MKSDFNRLSSFWEKMFESMDGRYPEGRGRQPVGWNDSNKSHLLCVTFQGLVTLSICYKCKKNNISLNFQFIFYFKVFQG